MKTFWTQNTFSDCRTVSRHEARNGTANPTSCKTKIHRADSGSAR